MSHAEDGNTNPPKANLTRFLLPSLLGAFFFLFPVSQTGVVTIPLGVLADTVRGWLGSHMSTVVLLLVAISAGVSSLFYVRRVSATDGVRQTFVVGPVWLALRVLGLALAVMIYFQLGPEVIWSQANGGTVMHELATSIVTIFLFAGLLLPLLTDYGLMEFVGTLVRRPFRVLFTLPGRAAIDALASWMAAAAVGILITSHQYNKGFYTGREASVIATNFSVVSLPFCLLVAQFVGLEHQFVAYYATVVVTGIVTAIILPRIWPLSAKKDDPIEGAQKLDVLDASSARDDQAPKLGLWRTGVQKAMQRAAEGPGPRRFVASGVANVFDIWFGLMPPIIAIATLSLVVSNHTPIMTWLSLPLVPFLELLRIPEADLAAPALLVGFADMFLPAILAKNIESELTRFIIITVSITQLVYMSEVGVLILKTKIPLRFTDLIVIFLERTLVSIPVVTLVAHFIIA